MIILTCYLGLYDDAMCKVSESKKNLMVQYSVLSEITISFRTMIQNIQIIFLCCYSLHGFSCQVVSSPKYKNNQMLLLIKFLFHFKCTKSNQYYSGLYLNIKIYICICSWDFFLVDVSTTQIWKICSQVT